MGDDEVVELEWVDEQIAGLIGNDKNIMILSHTKNTGSDKDHCVIFHYDGSKDLHALRWSLGAIMPLGTTVLEEAKGSINTMRQIEEASRANTTGAEAGYTDANPHRGR